MRYEYNKMFRELRMSLGISQAKFARLVGATRDVVANYENGRGKPSADILMNFLALRNQVRSKRKAAKSVRA